MKNRQLTPFSGPQKYIFFLSIAKCIWINKIFMCYFARNFENQCISFLIRLRSIESSQNKLS